MAARIRGRPIERPAAVLPAETRTRGRPVSDQIAIDNEYVTLLYNPEAAVVHHAFHQLPRSACFRETLTSGCELMRRNGGAKWLSDDRRIVALTPDDSQWLVAVWYPMAVAAGWKHWAVVRSEKVVGRLNLRQWVERYTGFGLNVRVFDDPTQAMEWLVAQ